MLAPRPLAATPGSASLDIALTGLRSSKGMLRICVTANRRHFPDCAKDPAARQRSVPASSRAARLDGIPAGTYAIALFHDENGNGRLDKFAGIPREGVGFSRNPRMRFGPPKFDETAIALSPGQQSTSVRIRYFL